MTSRNHRGRAGPLPIRKLYKDSRSTEEFVEQARDCKHPFDNKTQVPPAVAKAMVDIARLGPSRLEQKRKRVMEYWTKVKEDLAPEEKLLKDRLDPEVREIVGQKSILLFRAMLEHIAYDDVEVANLLVTGVKLIGELERTGIWPPDPTKAPKTTTRLLWAGAREAQAKVLEKDIGERWSKDDQELWDETQAEVKAGNLVGPFSPEQLEKKVGRLWIAARRFAVRQGEKLRPIDDFSEFGTNSAFGSSERVRMKNLDQVVAWSRAWAEAASDGKKLRIDDTASNVWEEKVHEEWGASGLIRLRGRVADLKQAYKQLPSSPAHKALGVIAVRAPGGGRELYRAKSLMFGTSAAVYAFLRFSRAIAALGTSLLSLVLIEFFDDFTQVEPAGSMESAQIAMEGLIDLLGWKLSTSEEKRKPFMESFVSLGVMVDFGEIEEGILNPRNKPGRVESIEAVVNEILESNNRKMDFKQALSLRGKLAFAEGQTFCRLTAYVARALSEWAAVPGPRELTAEMEYGLRFAVEHLKEAGPRRIRPKSDEPPILIFTDGACEEFTSIGGVLLAPGKQPEVFGCIMKEEDTLAWKTKRDQKQVIGQAEIFPVLVAKLTWAQHLEGNRAICFVDNESAKIALIRAYSPVLASLRLVMDCAAWDYHNDCASWYTRVPTCCNIADSPSRMELSALLRRLGARVVEPVFPEGMSPAKVLK